MSAVTAELVGGPRCGEVIALGEVMDEVRLPVVGPIGFLLLLDPTPEKPVARYRPLVVDGLPSLTDAGHYRYRLAP